MTRSGMARAFPLGTQVVFDRWGDCDGQGTVVGYGKSVTGLPMIKVASEFLPGLSSEFYSRQWGIAVRLNTKP